MLKKTVRFVLNGEHVSVLVSPAKPLLWVLRNDFGLTGAKPGCEEGECGACTILVDGNAVASCLMMVAQAEGHDVTTVEGLVTQDGLDIVQQAFVKVGAPQCGYCMPGVIMSAKALLERIPNPTTHQITRHLAGNICRCGNYPRIVQAVVEAAKNSQVKFR